MFFFFFHGCIFIFLSVNNVEFTHQNDLHVLHLSRFSFLLSLSFSFSLQLLGSLTASVKTYCIRLYRNTNIQWKTLKFKSTQLHLMLKPFLCSIIGIKIWWAKFSDKLWDLCRLSRGSKTLKHFDNLEFLFLIELNQCYFFVLEFWLFFLLCVNIHFLKIK